MIVNTQGSDISRLYEMLAEKRDKLRIELEEVEQKFEAVATTLKLMGQPIPGVASLDLTGKSVVEALVAIARANGNVLVAKTAKRLMTRAGLFSNTKHASSALFTAINRSGKFRRMYPGKYELIEQKEAPAAVAVSATAVLSAL